MRHIFDVIRCAIRWLLTIGNLVALQITNYTRHSSRIKNPRRYNMSLDPWFVTGLTEGEGCFSISFTLRKRIRVGIETRPSMSISLNCRDLDLLKQIHAYFKCGGIRYSRSDRTYKFEVRSIDDITKRIIPHFEKFQLQGAKQSDFLKFVKICKDIKANLHVNKRHLKKIIELAYQMNPSGKRKHDKYDLLKVLGEIMV